MHHNTLREVSNLSVLGDAKQRLAQRSSGGPALGDSYRLGAPAALPRASLPGPGAGLGLGLGPGTGTGTGTGPGTGSGLSLSLSLGRGSSVDGLREGSRSPGADGHRARDPTHCAGLVKDIAAAYMAKERQMAAPSSNGRLLASPRYLTYQPEINEKMRMILIDWLIDVHLKFKMHPETMFLAVNIIDRYLSCVNTKRSTATYVARSQLQLVGITSMLVAAKYEEIWPPEVKECVHISANTYTREEVIKMERAVCSALSFRLTVPTPFPFIVRLLSVVEGLEHQDGAEKHASYMTLLRHTSFFFLEHALLDYKCLQFTSSHQANASLFLALVTLRIKERGTVYSMTGETIWTRQLQYYSRAQVRDFKACADAILEFVSYVPNTKYQAVRRKYSSSKYGEAAKLMMPNETPDY